ncbi:hypothetical protein G4O51_08495 [Candidatus Bathyarchaeota archaeon A05DMB-2]|nr:hypothetical protein [Candidatus Bathyarchaeota archaeon A05DMB-2]
MGNDANEWVKKRIPELKREMGGKCQHKGCGEKRLSRLDFTHVRRTPISGTGPRGRKEKVADVNKHRSSYTLRCKRHHATDFKHQHRRFRSRRRPGVRRR